MTAMPCHIKWLGSSSASTLVTLAVDKSLEGDGVEDEVVLVQLHRDLDAGIDGECVSLLAEWHSQVPPLLQNIHIDTVPRLTTQDGHRHMVRIRAPGHRHNPCDSEQPCQSNLGAQIFGMLGPTPGAGLSRSLLQFRPVSSSPQSGRLQGR
jgi:hypothetical protein